MAGVSRWPMLATRAASRVASPAAHQLARRPASTPATTMTTRLLLQQPCRGHRFAQRRLQSTVIHGQPAQRSLTVRILRSTASLVVLTALSGLAGMTLAVFFIPKPTFDAFWAYAKSKPLSAAETLAQFDKELDADATPETRAINHIIVSHPLAQELRAASNEWKEARPHMKIPAPLRPTNLTAGTLAGPDRISVPPLIFNSIDAKTGKHDGMKMVALIHLGPQLCGHPGIVHGGLLATLLDEGLARCCFPALPNKMGVTANLTIDYRKPAMAALPANADGAVADKGGFFVLRAETTRVEGRKAWAKGYIEELPLGAVGGSSTQDSSRATPPKKVVEAEALFVEPRQAARMRRLYADDD